MGKPLQIDEVTIAAPAEGELRLRMISAGLCASDAHHVWGEQPLPPTLLPIIMGHEGAAIVESIGPNTAESTGLTVGDQVLTTFVPQCRTCKTCIKKKGILCPKENFMTLMSQAKGKLTKDDGEVFGYCGLGTYSEFILAKPSQVVKIDKIDKKANLENACAISCGVGCGYFSALTQVAPDTETAAIFGQGTVGLNVAAGCRKLGVPNIIGIDVNEERQHLAAQFGVTQFISASPSSNGGKSVWETLQETYPTGVEYVFECVGKQEVVDEALKCVAPFGTLVYIGVAPEGTEIRYSTQQLLLGRRLVGTLYGNKTPTEGINELVKLYRSGQYDIDKLVTHKFALEDINEAFESLKKGKSIKAIISFGQ